jgi:hypothetical protein
MPWARSLFWAEVCVNGATAPLMVVAPELVLSGMLGSPMATPTKEAVRWFGAMTFAFGFVLLSRALRADAATLRFVLEAFLVGDVLYTACALRWCWSQRMWTPGAIFAVAFSALLGAARVHSLGDISAAMPGRSRGSPGGRRGERS